MVFGVFTAVWPKLFSKMNSSHGVWLLWLVLVQRFCPLGFSPKSLWVMCLGVCVGLCLLWWGGICAVHPPLFWNGLVGNCLLLVCAVFSLLFHWFPMISFEFHMISHIGVGCPTNPTPLVRNPHPGCCMHIFPLRFLQSTLWMIVLVCVWGCVCCGGVHFCSASPIWFQSFLGKCLLLVCAFFCFLYGWVPLGDSHWNLHMPNPLWNMHGFHRWGAWCSSPKLVQACAPPNLPCPNPLPKEWKSCLSMVWGWGCTNRCRLGRPLAS